MKAAITILIGSMVTFAGPSALGERCYYYQTRLFVVSKTQDQASQGAASRRPFLVLCADLARKTEAQANYLANLFNTRDVVLMGEAGELQWKVQEDGGNPAKVTPPRIVQTVEIESARYEICLMPKMAGGRIASYEIRVARVETGASTTISALSPLASIFDDTPDGPFLRNEVGRVDSVLVCFPSPGKIYALSISVIEAVGFGI
jgi:hypothetical protein